jgi:3-hydroxyisobutyrate dehydrogenase
MTVGFLGLGRMGEPMATRLVADGVELLVWNRSSDKVDTLTRHGARGAASADEVFERCEVVIMMLADDEAIDQVLGRATNGFRVPVEGRTVVNMGTMSVAYSAALAAQLQEHGACYVEAPVSGSRVPAQNGELVAMLAGDPASLDVVEQLVAPLTMATFRCGLPPAALGTKLAVNVFLITLVTGLAESLAFAERLGLDLATVRAIIDAGPMSSAVSRLKLAKVLEEDWSPQASISNVLYNNRVILDAAYDLDVDLPLISVCERLYAATESAGLGGSDMIAVLEALRLHLTPTMEEMS